MTTRNVNSSCDVIWISRQDNTAIDALFKSSIDPVTSIQQAFNVLEGTGALWLAEGYANIAGLSTGRNGNYLYPEGTMYSDVVQCNWSKDISSPAGVFSMQVKPRIDWDLLIKPGDLFIIFMDDDHRYDTATRTAGNLITVGLVDRIARATMVDNNGATVESISINGRDLGMIFQETQLIFDPTLPVLDDFKFNAKFFTETSQDQVSALSPVETVLRLLDLIYNQNATESKHVGAQWALPSAPQNATGRPVSLLSLINVTEFTQRPMFGYAMTQPFGIAQAGNVWTLLESYANRTVNEFFFDIRDMDAANLESIQAQAAQSRNYVSAEDELNQDRLAQRIRETEVFNQSTLEDGSISEVAQVPSLIHRQMPFDLDAFMSLPVIDIDHTEVFEFEMGTAAHEVANYFEVRFPDIPEISQEMLWGIKINMRSLARFGIRRMEAETRFPFTTSKLSTTYAEEGSSDFSQVFSMYVGLLSTWYATQETLFNGGMTCRFMPKVRVGTRIRFRSVSGTYFHFYVTALSHVFSTAPGASRTSLTLVRGIREGGSELANNLIWRPGLTASGENDDGESIPEDLLKYVRVNQLGIEAK